MEVTHKEGVPVHKQASPKSAVIARIKSRYEAPGEGPRTLYAIVDRYARGWFRVVRVIEPDTAEEERVFSGTGWIETRFFSADGAGTGTVLFAAPHADAAYAGTLRVEQGAKVLSCRGDWLEVHSEVTRVKGWAREAELCLNANTNCN